MEDLERKRAALEAKLAELERALGQAMLELQSSRADPVKRAMVSDCLERLWSEQETIRAELDVVLNELAKGQKR